MLACGALRQIRDPCFEVARTRVEHGSPCPSNRIVVAERVIELGIYCSDGFDQRIRERVEVGRANVSSRMLLSQAFERIQRRGHVAVRRLELEVPKQLRHRVPEAWAICKTGTLARIATATIKQSISLRTVLP
jgi:hypothetical protein